MSVDIEERLRGWEADGTLARLGAAEKSRQAVSVKRSSGDIQKGWISAVAHGGSGIVVAFDTPDGERTKYISTTEFLELNPGLGGPS